MSDLNSAEVTGRLVRDVEIKTTQTGKVLTNNSVAVGYGYKVNNEWKNQTDFVDFTAWGTSASRLEGVKKGTLVFVKGRLQQEQWEDNGVKKSKLKIRADLIELIVPRAKKDKIGTTASEPSQAEQSAAEDDIPF